MATSVMARRTGIYRCTGIGQTVSVKAGEQLPTHTTCEGGCEWIFRSEDNSQRQKATVIIGNDPYFVLIIDEVPAVGDILNLRGGLAGRFRVTTMSTISRKYDHGNMLWPHLLVQREGNHQKQRFIYQFCQVTI